MATPTKTLTEIYATLLGKTPTIEEMRSLVAHVDNNQTDIAAFQGASTPGWNAAIDQRWSVVETSSSATAFTASMADASGNALVAGMWILLRSINQFNTGAATLDVGSTDGATPIKKMVGSDALNALDKYDLSTNVPALLMFTGTNWLLLNPKPTDSVPLLTTLLSTAASGTHTLNSNTKYFSVEVVGGGGGGGGKDTDSSGAGGGGGGGGCSSVFLEANDGVSLPYTVGAGGTAGTNAATATAGGNGGTSTIDYNVTTVGTATGGTGGGAGNGTNSGSGGAGGAGSNGDINTDGQQGGFDASNGGDGGDTSGRLGSGAIVSASAVVQKAGKLGGGGSGSASSGTGVATDDGYILIKEYS